MRKIGRGGIPSIQFKTEDGNIIILEGIADRIDVSNAKNSFDNEKSYVKIIDYKTGNKTFSEENLEKGLGIQLMIYLFSLLQSDKDKYLPGGALYFSHNLSSVRAEPNENAGPS